MSVKKLSIKTFFKENINHTIDVQSTANSSYGSESIYNFYLTSSETQIFTISFTVKPGFYYSSQPKISIQSPNRKNFKIEQSNVAIGDNELISKTFTIKHKGDFNYDDIVNISASYKISKSDIKITDIQSKIKEITNLKNELSRLKEKGDFYKTDIIENELKKAEQDVETIVVKEDVGYGDTLLEKPTVMSLLQIKSLYINTSNLQSDGEKRNITIKGDNGSEFIVIVTKTSNNQTYDPVSNTFKTGSYRFTSQIKKGSATLPISFPSISANETYNINLITINAQDNTGQTYPLEINQFAKRTLTFSLISTSNNSSYNTLPDSYTISKEYEEAKEAVKKKSGFLEISWDVSLASANDLSLSLIRQPLPSDWFVTKNINTDDPDDLLANTRNIKLDNVDNLGLGLKVTGSSPFDSTATQFITGIDKDNNKIEVTSSQNLNDNQALTFIGSGPKGVYKMLNSIVNFSKGNVKLDETTTTTDNSVSGTTVHVASTKGVKDRVQQVVNGATSSSSLVVLDSVANLAEGMFLTATSSGSLTAIETRIKKIDVTNKKVTLSSPQTLPNDATLDFNACKISATGVSGNTYVQAISAGANVTSTSSQTLDNGIAVSFGNVSSKSATIKFNVDVSSMGNLDKVIFLELDNFLNVH
tara:strand:- start:1640 stop:3577 length:1938 start_codon:yes stop_codon:yes gene_type:complete